MCSPNVSSVKSYVSALVNNWVSINTVNKFLWPCFALVVIILERAMYDHAVEPGSICLKIFVLILGSSFAMQKREEEGNIYLCFFHIYIFLYLYCI